MKIQFNVLWFDDTADFFDSIDQGHLNEQIRGWGFEPKIDLVTTPASFSARAPYADCDLIVVDFNLQEHGHGQDFISQVRSQNVFTEVVFYSSAPSDQLWQAIFEKRLEGVYVASRQNIQERMLQIGEQTVRKVLDLENMRGIVMAGVGDLDLLLDDILIRAINRASPQHRAQLFERFYEKLSHSLETNKEKLAAFRADPTAKKLVELCDSDKRWQNYERIAKFDSHLKASHPGDYRADILKPRNFLAHGIPQPSEDGAVTFLFGADCYKFDGPESASLRQRIIRYRSCFVQIQAAMSG